MKNKIFSIFIFIFIIACSSNNNIDLAETNQNEEANQSEEANGKYELDYIWWEEVPDDITFDLSGKSILIAISDQFNHQEVQTVKKHWENWGANVIIAANKEVVSGYYWEGNASNLQNIGIEPLQVDMHINNINISDFDAIFFPGNYSSYNLLEDKNIDIIGLINDAFNQGIYLAGLCHGPYVLAKAGVIEGKKVTGFGEIIGDIQAAGGEYVTEKCVVDGLIITANWAYFGSLTVSVAECLSNN